MNSRRRSTAKRTARNKRRRILRLKAARKYISAGFKLVLLQPKKKGDSRSGKLPATAHGVNDASTDIGFVATHLRKQPRAGLALAMGGAKRWVCLDIDARSGGYDTLKNFEKEHGCLPQTLTYETGGGGEHRIFRLPEGYVPRKGAKMPGIDVLFESRYAVAPPTMHGSGKRYNSRAGCSLDEIRPLLLPESLLKFIFEPDRSASKTSHSPRDQRSAVIIPEGQRNTTLTSAAGKLRADGLEEEEIRKALSLMNLKCAPPLSEDEVNRI